MSNFVVKRVPIVEAPTLQSTIHRQDATMNLESMDERTTKVELEKEEKESKERKKKVEKEEAAQESMNRGILREQQLHRIDQLYDEGKRIVFGHIMYEYYRRSLNLDESFIMQKSAALRAHMETFLKENGDLTLLEASHEYPKNIKRVVESITRMVLERLTKESAENKTPVDELEFTLNEDEKEKVDEELDNLSIDEVAELVKKKVLQVVIDEKKTAMRQEEEIEATEKEIAENEEIQDEKDLKEALQKIHAFQNPVKEYSLFGAIMKRSYQQLLESDESFRDPIGTDNEQFQDDEMNEEVEFTDDFDENIPEDKPMDAEVRIPDKALAESVCVYTTYELFHTLQMLPMTPSKIRALAESIAYGLQ